MKSVALYDGSFGRIINYFRLVWIGNNWLSACPAEACSILALRFSAFREFSAGGGGEGGCDQGGQKVKSLQDPGRALWVYF